MDTIPMVRIFKGVMFDILITYIEFTLWTSIAIWTQTHTVSTSTQSTM